MEAPFGYVEVKIDELRFACISYFQRRFRNNYKEIKSRVERLMKKRKGWPWNRKCWTRQDAEKYLRGSADGYFSRLSNITLQGWGTEGECATLLRVARQGTSNSVLVDVSVWDRIVNAYKEKK